MSERPTSASDAHALRARSIGVGATDPWTELRDAGSDQEARRSRRSRALGAQSDEESATFAGLLLDLAERGCTITVALVDGWCAAGTIVSLGPDVVVLRTATGSTALACSAIARIDPGAPMRAASDRTVDSDATLTSLLQDAAPLRPDVTVTHTGGSAPIVGRLVSCGVDVATLRTSAARLVHVRTAAITTVHLHDRVEVSS